MAGAQRWSRFVVRKVVLRRSGVAVAGEMEERPH